MARTQQKPWIQAALPILAAFGYLILAQPAQAVPAFARKYHVRCYNCHMIPPVLNKTGYMFKRLGYRLPPDEMDGSKPAPKISELDKGIKFAITNSLALVMQGSFTWDKTGVDTPISRLNLDEASLFLAGSLPQSNFSYFAEYKLYQDSKNELDQAVVGYYGGRANSSFLVKAGEMHIQEGEGTRAAMLYSLFPEPPPVLINVNALNFSLDQHPVGVNVGYTWASNYFKQIFAVSTKVTNGLNADGSANLFNSTKNSKDFWLDADYWFGPDGGVTFMTYYGRKDQVQNQGAADEFTYRPNIRRYGIFGNYLFFDELDVLGGYLRGRDDWKDEFDSKTTDYTSNGYRGELDYYIKRGFALMGRYDRLSQAIAGGPAAHTVVWSVGSEKALTELGNVVIRATYNHEHLMVPVLASVTTDQLFKLDFRLMW